MGTRFACVSSVLAVVLLVLSIDPLRRYTPSGGGEANEESSGIQLISLDGAIGPESLAFDATGGGPYTGVSDGRILQWQGPDRGWRQFAVSAPHVKREYCGGSQHRTWEHVCGRPLGLQFYHKTGDLYVADAYLGLLSVSPDGGSTKVVATAAQGVPFGFTNGVDIDQETGIVYFTDTSTRFRRRDFVVAVLCGDKTGRLMSYDPKTEEVKVLVDGLSFPNGLALSEDGSFLIVVETIPCRVLRYWLRSPRAGEKEVLGKLPGFPDNIKRSPSGGFWVAMHTRRSKELEMIVPLPWLGELLWKLPLDMEKVATFVLRWKAAAFALRLGEDGEVLETLVGTKGWRLPFISEVEERNGTLWMGSVGMPHLGVFRR